MPAVFARHIIVAGGDLPRLTWLVSALRNAGHAVFPVSDGEGAISIAHLLDRVDLLIASKDTPTVAGVPLNQLIEARLANVSVVYWDPDQDTDPAELQQLLSH